MRQRVESCLVWAAVFAAYAATFALLRLLSRVPPRSRRPQLRILATGRFNSRNWCRSHLLPLAQAADVGELLVVADGPVIDHPKITCCPVPESLRRRLPASVSRALWLLVIAHRERPDIIVGYHLFPGALLAALAARLTRARCIYQMTGGPIELLAGGAGGENALLSRLPPVAPLLERLTLRLAAEFDAVVVRGRRARRFLHEHAQCRRIDVIAGGLDPSEYQPRPAADRCYDLAFVGRLTDIKQPRQFIEVVKEVARDHARVRAVIVGTGPELPALRTSVAEFGLDDNIEFLGHREDVPGILARTRIFVLTSRTEGLSIALAEAMLAGAAPVVSNVGDLAELVDNDRTGWRVPSGDIGAFAAHIRHLLQNPGDWDRLSRAARSRAQANNADDVVSGRWARCLAAAAADQNAPARPCRADEPFRGTARLEGSGS
jgi:glycosyltransferase involved in cell wall biosynthesis